MLRSISFGGATAAALNSEAAVGGNAKDVTDRVARFPARMSGREPEKPMLARASPLKKLPIKRTCTASIFGETRRRLFFVGALDDTNTTILCFAWPWLISFCPSLFLSRSLSFSFLSSSCWWWSSRLFCNLCSTWARASTILFRLVPLRLSVFFVSFRESSSYSVSWGAVFYREFLFFLFACFCCIVRTRYTLTLFVIARTICGRFFVLLFVTVLTV